MTRRLLISLTGERGALTGTMTLGDLEYPISSWQRGGDAGHVNARSGALQITIALNNDGPPRSGAMTIGGTGYALANVIVDGLEISGEAEVSSDPFWQWWEGVG